MKGLIQASLGNPYAVIVMSLTMAILGSLALLSIPVDILPVFRSPAVQILTFYGGMPAEGMEKDVTLRMEKWTGQANGMKRQESRSITGTSIVRNYFQDGEDPNGALTQVNSLALATLPYLPPGTLPPVVLPFDPTSTTPIALVAMSSKTLDEAVLYDIGRLEVRNMIMQNPGATAPVVIGGKLRAVVIYLDQKQMQARGLSSADIMNAVERYHIFFPSGNVKIGDKDIALSSNSMFELPERMGDIPIFPDAKNRGYLSEVAKAKDSSFIQTNVVLVNGKRQVYIPVYRQVGASTLTVVGTLKEALPEIKAKLSEPDVDLTLVMDQSIYVRASIEALVQEGFIGAILCSLVILLFLGQWRMTLIAILTLPLSVFVAITCLYAFGHTINVMTLAGLTLAIGPMIDSAIICLENTHRHLSLGAAPKQAALDGASEVAMPELVSTLCTFLVLTPLILVPGMGRFLFLPLTLAVVFAMTTAYLLSRTLVPCASAFLLSAHDHHVAPRGIIGRAFARLEETINQGIQLYCRALDVCLYHRGKTVIIAFTLLAVTLVALLPVLRRDFFPEADSGAFEIAVRGASGTRIENTEIMVKKVDQFIRENIPEEDLQLTVCELGTSADWSAAYTANSGPMDALVKVQLSHERTHTSQEYVRILRKGLNKNPEFAGLEFSFDSGGLIRGALNEGRSSPINIQLVGKNQHVLFGLADKILAKVKVIDGIVDARVLEKEDAPELLIEIDRKKAQEMGLNQREIMESVIAATNSSIMYNKKSFWIDPKSGNQYFVGVQYRDEVFRTFADILDITITGSKQGKATPIPLKNVATIVPRHLSTEVHHVNLQPAIDLTMNVEGRDLGHVSDDVTRALRNFGKYNSKDGSWSPYDPNLSAESAQFHIIDRAGKSVAHWKGRKGEASEAEIRTEKGKRFVRLTGAGGDRPNGEQKEEEFEVVTANDGKDHVVLPGSKIILAGEYTRMQETFRNLGVGLILASLLIYFLMVALDKSFIVPLAVMLIVPLCLIGILPMLLVTGSAINVQSLLGFIFTVGIKVANTVLMTDYAQELRRHEGLTPVEAIRKAASLRVRPVTMTALAAFFAMIPTALALEHGSEANAPLARAILGGLLAGEPATLFVLPALYALMVRDKKNKTEETSADHPHSPEAAHG
jgi:multidrug efflux pump subunit AcrB